MYTHTHTHTQLQKHPAKNLRTKITMTQQKLEEVHHRGLQKKRQPKMANNATMIHIPLNDFNRIVQTLLTIAHFVTFSHIDKIT